MKGPYDLNLRWTPPGVGKTANGDAAPVSAISIFDAIERQLGLKLESTTRNVAVIVVDSVNRTPTENAPGTTMRLPASPTEFEAATIKPNKAGGQSQRILARPGGRVEVGNLPLRELIAMAWGFLGPFPNFGASAGSNFADMDRVVGAPPWIESGRFDIVAKTAILPGEAAPLFNDVRRMLQPLLLERFKMKVHIEDQPVPVWTLVVGKRGPKLDHADPSSRSGCKRTARETGTGSAAMPMVTYTCRNTTMAQLADSMRNITIGAVDRVAVDITGLKDGYDFILTWSPNWVLDGVGTTRASGPGQPASASDPTGGTTFLDALEKQLGLRLESGKHPMPVLVIDHIEQLGPEN